MCSYVYEHWKTSTTRIPLHTFLCMQAAWLGGVGMTGRCGGALAHGAANASSK
jgi:hypothetical protein